MLALSLVHDVQKKLLHAPHHAGQGKGSLVAIAAYPDLVPEMALEQIRRFEPHLDAPISAHVHRRQLIYVFDRVQ